MIYMLWKQQYRATDNLPSDEELEALEVVRRFVDWAVPIFRALADACRNFIEACYNLFASMFSGSTSFLAHVLRQGVLEDRRAAGVLRYEAWRDRWRSWLVDRANFFYPDDYLWRRQAIRMAHNRKKYSIGLYRKDLYSS